MKLLEHEGKALLAAHGFAPGPGETPLDAQGPLAAIAIRMYKPR